jgi:hypothetical protein
MPTARAKYERYKGRLTPSTSRSLLLTLAPAQKIQRRGGQFGLPMPWGRNAGKRKRPGKLIRAEVKMEVQGWTVWHSCVSGVFRHGGKLVSCSRQGLSFVHNGHAPARGGPAWGARAGTNVRHGGVTHVCLATKFLTLRAQSGIYSPQVANCARPQSVIVYITESMLIDCSVAYPSSTKRFMPSRRLMPEMVRLDRNRPLSRTSSSVVILFMLLFRLAKLWRNHWRRPPERSVHLPFHLVFLQPLLQPLPS